MALTHECPIFSTCPVPSVSIVDSAYSINGGVYTGTRGSGDHSGGDPGGYYYDDSDVNTYAVNGPYPAGSDYILNVPSGQSRPTVRRPL